jgi:hypothetical protein
VARSVSTFQDALTRLGHHVFVFAQQAPNDYEETEPYVFRYPAVNVPQFNHSITCPTPERSVTDQKKADIIPLFHHPGYGGMQGFHILLLRHPAHRHEDPVVVPTQLLPDGMTVGLLIRLQVDAGGNGGHPAGQASIFGQIFLYAVTGRHDMLAAVQISDQSVDHDTADNGNSSLASRPAGRSGKSEPGSHSGFPNYTRPSS